MIAAAVMQMVGAAMKGVAGYYGALSQKATLKSQALSQEYEAGGSRFNAMQAERDAQSILQAGQAESGRMTAMAGLVQGKQLAAQGARGVVQGVGSAAEELASTELIKKVDAYTINLNSTLASNAARQQAQNYRNDSLLQDVSARNLRRTAKSINPWAAAGAASLDAAGGIASQWQYQPSRMSSSTPSGGYTYDVNGPGGKS